MAGTLSIGDACRALVAQNIEPDEVFLRSLARGDTSTGGDTESISLRDLVLWAHPGDQAQIAALKAALLSQGMPQTPAALLADARRVAGNGRYPLGQLGAARAAMPGETSSVDRESVQDALAVLNLAPAPHVATPCDAMARPPLRDGDIELAIAGEDVFGSLGILQQVARLDEGNVHAALSDGYAAAQRMNAGRDFVSRITLGLDGPAPATGNDEWLAQRSRRLLDLTNAAGDDQVLLGRIRALSKTLLAREDVGTGLRDHLETQLAREATVYGGDFLNAVDDDSRWSNVALNTLSLANAHHIDDGSPRQKLALAYAYATVAHDIGAARAHTNDAAIASLLERLGASGRDPFVVQHELAQRAAQLTATKTPDGERLAATLRTIEQGVNGPWQPGREPSRIDVFASDKAAAEVSEQDIAALVNKAADELTARLTAMTDEQRARIFASPGSIAFYLGCIEKGYGGRAFSGNGQLYFDRGRAVTGLPPLDPAHPDEAIAALRKDFVDRLTTRLDKLHARLAGAHPLERAEVRINWPQFVNGDVQLFPQTPPPDPPTFIQESNEHHDWSFSLGDW